MIEIENEQKPLLRDDPCKGRKKLTWANVVATVPTSDGTKRTVLNDVSGVARPSEVLAMMGGSGAGKTTLMNILAHLPTKGVEFAGNVLIDGMAVSLREMRQISAYVQQVDAFCGTLTVREQLTYSALLRISSSMSRDEKMQRVEQAINDMNLVDCQETFIGIPNRVKGISVGEKKRLAFACEILTDPAILFCDEPTSGLDSFMASQVVQALLDLAAKGKTIVVVLHQPSSTVFRMFHKVCFMANGKTAYHGPVSELCTFFTQLGPEFRVPESYNPADHVMSKLAVNLETEREDRRRIEFITAAYQESVGGKALKKSAMAPKESLYKVADEKINTSYAVGFFDQFYVLFLRSFKTTLRDPLLLKVRFVQIVLTALIIGAVNFRTDIRGPTVMNVEGVLFNCARDMTFLFYYSSVNIITSELPLFMREHKARIYSVEAYYLARSLAELPQYALLPAVYGLFVYWMTGLDENFFKFFIFTVVCILMVLVSVSLAYVGACIFIDEGLAVTYMPMFVLPMLVLGGFYINEMSIPTFLLPFSYLSWFKYGFQSLELIQWSDYGEIADCGANRTGSSFCPANDGAGILQRREITSGLWVNIGMMTLFVFVYRLIGLVALNLRVHFSK